MGIHIPTADEVADFLDRDTAKTAANSRNCIMHFSRSITLKIFLGAGISEPRKKRAHLEQDNNELFRSRGVNVPTIYGLHHLRELQTARLRSLLHKRPWVAVMERIWGKRLSGLSSEQARGLQPDFDALLQQLQLLRLNDTHGWTLNDLFLGRNDKIYILDLETSEPGRLGGLKSAIEELRAEYKDLLAGV